MCTNDEWLWISQRQNPPWNSEQQRQSEYLTQINFNYLNPSNSAAACYPSSFCLSDPCRGCWCSARILCYLKTLSGGGCLKLCYHELGCCWWESPAFRPWISSHLLGREMEKETWNFSNQISAAEKVFCSSKSKLNLENVFEEGKFDKRKIELRVFLSDQKFWIS